MRASWIEGTGKHTFRPMVMGTTGMVSGGHPLATQAALQVLMEGGNVVDAAVAASAVLAVARPHMTGVGGDLFCLIYLVKTGRVVAINASGPAPKSATIEYFHSHGMRHVPTKGPLSVETPGCVAGWDLAVKKHGTMPLSRLLRHAIDYAEKGVPVTRSLAEAIAKGARDFSEFPTWMATFVPDGRVPRPGEKLKLSGLARSLRTIGEGGAEVFYRGELASTIAECVQQAGGLLSNEDLAGCEAEELEPLHVDYRGYTVYEQPPVSQGYLVLQELAMAEGFELSRLGPESAEAVHLMVECKKLAFADRLRYMGDPAWVGTPLNRLFSKEYAAQRRKSIDPDRAILAAAPGAFATVGPDTTHHCVMDADGNCVTMIQSLFQDFGSAVVVGDTGITLNDRLASFFLEPAHPNALDGGKRTIHTLNTFMMFKDGRPFLAAGTPGMDDQVQINFQIVSDLVDHGMSLQEAIEAPRWSSIPGTSPGAAAAPYELRLEDGYPEAVLEQLRQKGHRVELAERWRFGSASAVLLDPETGVLYGGSDPRRDGYTSGW